jgi:glycosyltransferase involved in cell wall biosynthesis|nr:glycosyltransferase family 4 protein [uncultured Halomonas sp.]|tara:strand:- start:3227 stop:4381 length:1155 start_codon:yes stop_codon:yes gene_type:complete
MKIVFFENSSQKGGSLQSLNLICKHLADEHSITRVFANYDRDEIEEPKNQKNIYVSRQTKLSHYFSAIFLKINSYLNFSVFVKLSQVFERKQVEKFRKVIEDENPDLIVFNNPPHIDRQAIKAAEMYPAKKICHLRLSMFDSIYKEPYFKSLLDRNVHKYIANSYYIADNWIENWGLSADKIEVVHNSIDMDKTCGQSSAIEIITKDKTKTHVCCVGRINYAKGQEFLINTFMEEQERLSDFTLTIIGDGRDAERLKSLVINSGFEEQIKLLGKLDKAKQFMHYFDVAVVPSEFEAFGNVVLEWMNFSVPVIATNSGGPAEIIANERDGLLFEYGDKKSLVEALLRLKNDQELYKTISINALKKIESEFSESTFIDKLKAHYFT